MTPEKDNYPMEVNNQHQPFWNPWGTWGCLWRILVFLLGIVLICLILASLLRGCGNDKENLFNPFAPNDSVNDPYKNVRDTTIVADWNDSIPGIKELPAPDDNYIPRVDSTSIITNPEDSLSQIVDDQLIVFFNSKNLKQDMATFAQKFKAIYPDNGYSVLYYNPTAGTMLLRVPQDKLQQVANELPQKITEIDFCVATNAILKESGKPSDPGFSVQKYDEYFRLIQAYDAWGITRGSSNVKVAIVDSYFDLTNPEIGQRYVDAISIPTKTKNVLPPAKAPVSLADAESYCHGSHVAGLAIGGQNNKLGCSGIAPLCSWMPVSLGDQLTSFNIIEGIMYAIYHKADVVNVSIGRLYPAGTDKIPLMDQVSVATSMDKLGEALWEYVVKIANDHNCVLVTAAGNDNILMGMDPMKRSKGIITVEAVDNRGMKANFSDFGEVPEVNLNYSTVSAPGVQLWSVSEKRCEPIWKNLRDQYGRPLNIKVSNGFQEMDGTSMASPVVAGAVALLKSKKKSLTTEQIINILTTTGKRFDTKHRIGPVIQIKNALNAVGGEMMNFDDVSKDHNKILGIWKSTHVVDLTETGTNKKLDELWVYFIFNSTTTGVLEFHAVQSKRIYKANLSVSWGANSVTIRQLSDAVSSDGNRVNADYFICTPNQNRLLKADCMRNGVKRYDFLLEKIK